MRTLALLLATWLAGQAAALAQVTDDPRQQGRMAPAVVSIAAGSEGGAGRKEFDFGRSVGKASLALRGDVSIDTWVQHRGLLCARHDTGVRFGQGSHGCNDVEWLTPPIWLTSVRQCNNALMQHTGVDTDDRLAAVFERVTCAQRLTRCEGRCD